ncbi:hypothetical protein AWC38_SpisGene22326, partial [Stylophora pistillata]
LLLAYVMVPIVQREVNTFVDVVWNCHRIREQRDTFLPDGVPNHIYSFPDEYGLEDCNSSSLNTSTYFEGLEVTEEQLEEVAELSEVLTSNDDYLSAEFRNKCEQPHGPLNTKKTKPTAQGNAHLTIGRDFIYQVTSHINDWNNGAKCQHIALKAAFVLLAVGLQKPGPKSKPKEHQELLSKRLVQWKDGETNKLLREGRIIQSRIGKLRSTDPPDKSKVFPKLVLEGQINSALRSLSLSTSGSVLPLTDEVMAQLQQKHPSPQPAKLGSLLFGPINDEFPESVYSGINGETVRQAALRTKGSGGPCGVDANGFRRMLACKSFKQSSKTLCEVTATMAKTLCIHYIDRSTIEPLLASRLIPLDKGEGAVRPIGVAEVIRRICRKCVMNIAKGDVVDASGSLQLCAGKKSGSEAAIHAVHKIFKADDTDAVLLIDAPNAFNSLNRAAALHNIRVLCTVIAVYAINTYRHSPGYLSPVAMSDAKQCWFADDACGAGTISEIKQWWDGLNTFGPDIGYFPNGKKCWIIAKPEKEALVREAFKDTAINVTVEGQKHLGAVIGSRDYLQDYVNEKVTSWVNEVVQLAEFAQIQPQASYAAYTFGLKHRWTYFLRTLPDVQDLLEPLEEAISQVLIPAIVGRKCSKLDRDVLALPVRLGGLSLSNPCHEAAREHASSIQVTSSLVEHIMAQTHQLPDESLIESGRQAVKHGKA